MILRTLNVVVMEPVVVEEDLLLLLGRRHVVCVERLLLLLLLLQAAHGRGHDGKVGWRRRALPSWCYWPCGAAVQGGTSTPHLWW